MYNCQYPECFQPAVVKDTLTLVEVCADHAGVYIKGMSPTVSGFLLTTVGFNRAGIIDRIVGGAAESTFAVTNQDYLSRACNRCKKLFDALYAHRGTLLFEWCEECQTEAINYLSPQSE